MNDTSERLHAAAPSERLSGAIRAVRESSWTQFALYIGVAVVFTWPLLPKLGSVVPSDPGDPLLNTWILWWNSRHLPLTAAAWNAPAFYPARGVLGFSETLLGISVFTNPVQWLGAGPQLAYNLAFLLSFPLSAFFAFKLAYELTGRRDAAFLAGLAFGFHPFRVAHFPQLQVLSGYFMPLGLYGLHRYLRDAKLRWLGCFALSWLLNGLANGYYLLFFSVFVGMWIVWFTPGRSWRTGAAILGAWLCAMLCILPVLLKYQAIHRSYGFTRNTDEIGFFSADISALLCTPDRLQVWGFLRMCKRPENELFPGLALPLLVLIGLCLPRLRSERLAAQARSFGQRIKERSAAAFYVCATLMVWLLSLGPQPSWLGKPGPVPGPYALLMLLPGFNGLRVPARFATLMMLGLAVCAAFAFAKLGPRLGKMRGPVLALFSVGILTDTWLREMPLAERPPIWSIEDVGGNVPLLELPIGSLNSDLPAMYRSMFHRRPIVNGFSGYSPPFYGALADRLRGRDPVMLTALASFGPLEVVVDRAQDGDGQTSAYVAGGPGAQLVRTTDTHTLYRLPASGSADPKLRNGARLTFEHASANVTWGEHELRFLSDGDFTTRWSAGRQRGALQELEIDLGRSQPIGSVLMYLAEFNRDYPRELRIQTSDDRATWTEAWHGNAEGETFAASIRDPKRIPICLALEGRAARYIRFQNTGVAQGKLWWSIAELEVRGVGP
ncbi:MAG TPA: discoidin domain-containing protein [Polyangiales bacterium]|nr:discoidin domain-containing protein [Polyangiales bacterium]